MHHSSSHLNDRFTPQSSHWHRLNLAGTATGRRGGIPRNRPCIHRRLVAPAPLIHPTNPVTLPSPKHPAARLLKCPCLGVEVAAIPIRLVGAVADAELAVVLDSVGDGDGPLADDEGVWLAAVVVADGGDVAGFGSRDALVPFVVAVVVEVDEVGRGEVAGGITGAPCIALPAC